MKSTIHANSPSLFLFVMHTIRYAHVSRVLPRQYTAIDLTIVPTMSFKTNGASLILVLLGYLLGKCL